MSNAAIPWLLFLAIGLAPALGGCGHKPAPAPPPPTVGVSRPLLRNVVDWDSYTGYLSSPQTANVAPRVSGLIIKTPFQEGTVVKEGDVLFVLDPRPFQADLDNKKAAVAQAVAQANQAHVHFQRYQRLKGTQAISEDDYDTAQAGDQEGKAALQAAQAALETSRLNLLWSRVMAPISGRISRMNVTVGNLVNSTGSPPQILATIVSTDPLYGYIEVPDSAYLHYQTLLELERRQGQPNGKVPCCLEISGHPAITGYLDFIDNAVDTTTGTIEVRGVFANPGWLIPGLYVTLRIPQGPSRAAMLIPATAVVVLQNSRSLMVIGPDDRVQSRRVEFGRTFGPLQAVVSGLQADDRVIVDGTQDAHPGMKVSPHEIPIPAQDLKALAALPLSAGTQPATAASRPSGTEPAP